MAAVFTGHAPDDEIESDTAGFYRQVLQTLAGDGIAFMVGGAFAFAHHTGLHRDTKDLDLFIRRADFERVAALMNRHGLHTELTFPHWLGKVHQHDRFVDLIFNSGNGLSPVDDDWFAHADESQVLGETVKVCPAEENVWTKAFIMERERYDGADVAHLLRACAHRLDWMRLRNRFGPHWRVLLSHLVLFGFIYPAERGLVPPWLMHELMDRLRHECQTPAPPTDVCAGTLLSREQYLTDTREHGYVDGRVPFGTMTDQDVATWTQAIPHRS
ncbi:nucleotidyltransferase [Piscinibacter terrae]|uniref:Nucleotidyltransferase family protein n=1 Tax=Piscinibacter terrae TaxID=2496871 RepID=A0A3N7JWC7_9BURK|nr:nucleotidyltransferase [Albitalea terrae]RQP25149.1 hypothetical protein DZC73_09885 [Albitalea terrae]